MRTAPRRAALAAAAAAAVAALPAAAQDRVLPASAGPGREIALASTAATEFRLAVHRVLDVDGDGRDDVLAVGHGGEVRVWRWDDAAGGLSAKPAGTLVLPEPERSVLAVADLLGRGGPPQLCVVSRRGVEAYPVGADGAYQRGPVLVSPKATLAVRVGQPRFAEVLRDVNGDGRPDLILPRGEACELWLAGPAGESGAPPELRSAGSFKVDVSRDRTTETGALSDVLESSFRIPSLAFSDVNGDGREDLVVEDGKVRSFHLARADGTVAPDPDVRVDISTFQDTTPGAEVRLGRTLAGGDDQRMDSADLDADGIPDHVISHRRKVWVFRGTAQGPQFTEPWQILRVSDDVSAMLVARLDADPRPDLLLLRVQVPTVATILRGLVASWSVDIGAVGYANDGGQPFEQSPKWKGDLELQLPAILGVLKDPDALVRRFERVATKFKRGFVWGDFDGDGREDAAVALQAERRLDVWFGLDREGAASGRDPDLGGVFFGEETVWDLDRVISWLGDFADRRFADVTGGREPALRLALRPDAEADLEEAVAADLDGTGPAEIVVIYTDDAGRGILDVWR